ncbi:kinesin-like protein Klp61F [Ceratina calcarata]|uniref:Kinesin-like protein n=1 Tax=Ceratina calcarata TaxID=156304 RepID=A0AAJ7S5U1_9HYME|nr:kinesin-like protein Klp61F [Ceratina calcarata]XP_026671285.1 kinesin-like protein Klp61F [Ceratina calcarata]
MEKQQIQVFVRVRPVNDAERAGTSMIVVDTPSNNEVVVREKPHDKIAKKFTFNKVFGPNSKQTEVYNAVVSPLLEEVLGGYNCTVFAYGQTGTGKTFTMEGTDTDPSVHWQTDTNAGIIPRALSHLFDELRVLAVESYFVRVSFLELYNEEIFDLLSSNDDSTKIRIYDDPTKKGAVIIHGLEEMPICNKNEVFKILQKGSEKRRTAPTLMNAQSSRSHTIFSITVHIKEATTSSENLLKTGKLNLVDLAGSENVGRSGAIDRTAREAGNVNQSLLTLGRVITALVEKTPHIPYRESKLTRLLQESLGGCTRTSIIATISPASINVEETLSTLNYAHRAKNITNQPEINHKFSKRTMLQEYTGEIARLKKDLLACRERNGVYLTQKSYNEMQSLIEFQNKEIEEKLIHINALETSMNTKEQIFNELKTRNSEQANELLHVDKNLKETVENLDHLSSCLLMTEQEREEQEHLVEKHAATENVLYSQVQEVLNVADTATTDVQKLHDKIYRKMQIQQQNSRLGQQFKANINERLKAIEKDELLMNIENMMKFHSFMKNDFNARILSFAEDIDKNIQFVSVKLIDRKKCMKDQLMKFISDSHLRYQQLLENEGKTTADLTEKKLDILNNVSLLIAEKIHQLKENKLATDFYAFKTDISKKYNDLIECTKRLTVLSSKRLVEDRDRSIKNKVEIQELVEHIRQSQKDILNKQRNFAKMMEDLQRCFNEMQTEENKIHCLTHDTLNNIDGISEIMNKQILDNYNVNTERENSLQETLENNLETVKQIVNEKTDKAQLAAENIAQCKILISQFQEDLTNNCNTFIEYRNSVERNITEVQQKAKKSENLLLSTINNIYTKLYTIGNEHNKSLDQYKIGFIDVLTKMSEVFEDENDSLANVNDNIVANMQTIHEEIDKLFTGDYDTPTGSTPVKRNFQYSRKLVKTSPQDQILRRFRETLHEIEHTENEPEDILNNDTPTKSIEGTS